MNPIGRRHVLGLGLAALAGARGAAAFQIQDMPVPTARAYRLACEAPANHARLLAEIDAQLAGRRLSDGEIAAIRGRALCPLCGCNLAALGEPLASDRPF